VPYSQPAASESGCSATSWELATRFSEHVFLRTEVVKNVLVRKDPALFWMLWLDMVYSIGIIMLTLSKREFVHLSSNEVAMRQSMLCRLGGFQNEI